MKLSLGLAVCLVVLSYANTSSGLFGRKTVDVAAANTSKSPGLSWFRRKPVDVAAAAKREQADQKLHEALRAQLPEALGSSEKMDALKRQSAQLSPERAAAFRAEHDDLRMGVSVSSAKDSMARKTKAAAAKKSGVVKKTGGVRPRGRL